MPVFSLLKMPMKPDIMREQRNENRYKAVKNLCRRNNHVLPGNYTQPASWNLYLVSPLRVALDFYPPAGSGSRNANTVRSWKAHNSFSRPCSSPPSHSTNCPHSSTSVQWGLLSTTYFFNIRSLFSAYLYAHFRYSCQSALVLSFFQYALCYRNIFPALDACPSRRNSIRSDGHSILVSLSSACASLGQDSSYSCYYNRGSSFSSITYSRSRPAGG